MRVLFVITSLGRGGAERVITILANHLSTSHEVALLTWDPPGAAPAFDIASRVSLIQGDRLGGRGLGRVWRLASRFTRLRRLVRQFQPGVVVSFTDTVNLTAIAACLGTGVPVVASERTDPSHHPANWRQRSARRLLYPAARHIVAVTSRAASGLGRRLQRNVVVIANPIAKATAIGTAQQPGQNGRYRVVALSGLRVEKGIELLIEAFGMVASEHPDWDLVIFGDGPERASLEAQVERLGIGSRISLPGATRDPERELAASNIFAIPSHYEGFPNALGEAMAVGLPSVGYANVSGVEDLLVDGITGILVEPRGDAAAFAVGLARLMDDHALRSRLGAAARLHVEQWSPARVLTQWEDLLLSVTREAQSPRAIDHG